MAIEDIKRLDLQLKKKGDERSDRIRAKLKGSSSERRKVSATINALQRNSRCLSNEQILWLGLCKNKEFLSLIQELIGLSLRENLEKNVAQRNKIVDQLISLIKSSGVNITNVQFQQMKTLEIKKFDDWLDKNKEELKIWEAKKRENIKKIKEIKGD